MMQRFIIGGGILFILACIGLMFLQLYFKLPSYQNWHGRIGERDGPVVSSNPGDIWITLNVPATLEEKETQYRKYIGRIVERSRKRGPRKRRKYANLD